jgi:hypothetical protein
MNNTTDIWFVTFLIRKKYIIDRYDIISPHRGKYYFKINDNDWKILKLEYYNSLEKEIKYIQESIKDLIN